LEALALAHQVLAIRRYLQRRSPRVFHDGFKSTHLIRHPEGALFLVDFGVPWVPGCLDVDPP
jgi:hypothetical protein